MKILPLRRRCPVWVGVPLVLLIGSACHHQTPTEPSSTASTTTPGSPPALTCSVTLQLNQSTVDLNAVQIRLTVTASATCQWSFTTPTWVSVVSKYDGTGTYVGTVGTGTMTLWLQVAPSTSARDGEISVGTSSVRLYQQPQCSLTLQQLGWLAFDQTGGQASVALSASLSTCDWSFDAPSWISVRPSAGTGSATVMVDVAPSDSARTRFISVAGYSLGVRQTPTGEAKPFAFVLLRCGTIRPGESIVGLCQFILQPGTNPTSSDVKVIADMRAVGGSGDRQLVSGPGDSGLGFTVDVHVPADMPPGLKPIPLTTYDAQGRTATATATIQVPPPP
jgi:hypothetical protein